jgi:multidrug transporter EmrE-like cation transporter
LADVLAGVWLLLAGLTSVVGVLEYEERSITANLLRIAIVVLMVVTAFLLVRYDVRRKQ